MKPIVWLMLLSIAVAGCGRQVARLDKLGRVQAAVLTDANALSSGNQSRARPPVQVTDPDRLAALEAFLRKHYAKWEKAEGTPRATRFQLELIANDRPLYTLWLEPGYMAVASGKTIKETRLSNAETAELLACLGLPADYLNPNPTGPGPSILPSFDPPIGHPATADPAAGGFAPPPQSIVPAGGEDSGRPGSVKL